MGSFTSWNIHTGSPEAAVVTHAVSIVQLHPENDAWWWMHKQRERERERWRLRGKCVSVCLSAFCLLSFLLLKIILLKAEYVGVGGQEFYNLKNNWQITKALFLMTCIKNLLPAEVNSLQLRQTQVLVFFLKQKQHLKMWVYLGLKEKKRAASVIIVKIPAFTYIPKTLLNQDASPSSHRV